MKYPYIFILILITIKLNAQEISIKGLVFEDINGNNKKDMYEPGVANVVVADQVSTTITDTNGQFELPSEGKYPYINITMPDGYKGIFYYPTSSEVLFPIQKQKLKSHFKFIHASDTHIDSLNLTRMERFRQMADSLGVDFIIISGDLIRDALRVNETVAGNYFKMYLSEIEKFKIPVYSGVGNHELFGIERDKSLVSSEHPLYGKKMYRHYLGPDYYSFNYGGIHFISIDGLDYQNLYYFGGVDSTQLSWISNDLKYIPNDMPVVSFSHIPFVSPGFSFSDYDNDNFYGPQLLMQDGHLRHRHIVYNFDEVKKQIGSRPHILSLSGHYHAAQECTIQGTNTIFAQTSAITRPDRFDYYGFEVRSGFTVYEIDDQNIMSSKFIPLNFK